MIEDAHSVASIVCLCGSTRFKTEFLAAAEREALAGRVVLMRGVFSQADGRKLSPTEIARLTALHQRKIAMADEVLVIDPDGRIGDATAEEIEFARRLGKTVRFWSKSSGALERDPGADD